MSDVKIFAKTIEPEAVNQIYTIAKHPAFENSKIRIMPDAHAGRGCVIGFTAKPKDGMVIPALVGSDISCGMLLAKLSPDTVINKDVLKKLDDVIRTYVPSGRDTHEEEQDFMGIHNLVCYDKLRDVSRILKSLGTLGGGNHFIELDKDEDGCHYLVIHTGSRNLGKQICDIYQQMAYDKRYGKDALKADSEACIRCLKAEGRQSEIEEQLKKLKALHGILYAGVPKDLCHLSGRDAEDYLHDAQICDIYAYKNRQLILSAIIEHMGWNTTMAFTTLHNYVDRDGFIRKGAVSALNKEPLLIPLNMRDGSLLCSGKGNPDWNYSAPHGAGRLFSRSMAKELVSLEEFTQSMEGIFTTSVCEGTLDESPFVYKDADEIKEAISDTVEIRHHLKPVYNFKAS